MHQVKANETIAAIAEELTSSPWRLVRDNGLWNQTLTPGKLLRVRTVPPRPSYVVHRVTRGENLTIISRRYGASVSAIQTANNMGRRTVIRIGEQLRIPNRGE